LLKEWPNLNFLGVIELFHNGLKIVIMELLEIIVYSFLTV